MPIDATRAKECLRKFDFKTLFIDELGWDHYAGKLPVTVDNTEFTLQGYAHKRGMAVLVCQAANSSIPDGPLRRKIERQVAKSIHEHLIIFIDAEHTTQIWQLARRELGKPIICRECTLHRGHSGEALIQRLHAIAFPFEEEEQLTLVDVVGRTFAAFPVERVTRRFYDSFKKEHSAFLKLIEGIDSKEDQEWYASIMLNRLMFVYFIQKKGFLDNNRDYLRNHLELVQQIRGNDEFLTFYRYFLIRLFHNGLGRSKDQRDPELEELLGDIPYLNGGIFEIHQLEEKYGEIDIADKAFEKIFDFFDQYQWHLDERPLRKDNEINPDVLGYIFEKYINQKQMGAYYTKEDITGYISNNTVIPRIFDIAKEKCKIAFEGQNSIWKLVQDNPNRYIYDAVKHGITVNAHEHPPKKLEKPLPLSKEIETGIKDIYKRTEWNKQAPAEYALPTEIWREVVARRRHYDEVHSKLANGEIYCINDFITYNLNIRQFAQDVIENCEGPELLRALYQAIESVTILDPTCGSGAFLFAALNILEPLYEACLDRMGRFIEEAGQPVPVSQEEEIAALIDGGESSTVEFKSSARWDMRQNKPNKEMEKVIVHAVAAMLNTKGGILFIGLDDDGTILGLKKDYKTLGKKQNRDGYENWLTTLLIGQFGQDCSLLFDISFCNIDSKDICRVSIKTSSKPAFVKDGKNENLFIRTGNSTRQLTAKETVDYCKLRWNDSAGEQVCDVPSNKKSFTQSKVQSAAFQDFQQVLESVSKHHNRSYFIYKSIIINNLFGVDIMEEAVEICKLRLFLKLVAQVVKVENMEPLPDIDFNIRAGNTLVGFASLEEVKKSMEGDFIKLQSLPELEEKGQIVNSAYLRFRQMQVSFGMDASKFAEAKRDLQERLGQLEVQLNGYLSGMYGITEGTKKAKDSYNNWLTSHQPFHWFIEFYGIITNGGFDVIIGNPPYVEYSKVKKDYRIKDYKTEKCSNLYPFCVERSCELINDSGRFSFIILMASISTPRMNPLRSILTNNYHENWFINLAGDWHPGKLFEGVRSQFTIVTSSKVSSDNSSKIYTTNYIRWFTEERNILLSKVKYALNPHMNIKNGFPKFSQKIELEIWNNILKKRNTITSYENKYGSPFFYRNAGIAYYLIAINFKQRFLVNSKADTSSTLFQFKCKDEFRTLLVGLLNSNLFGWYYFCFTDCYHLTKTDLEGFKIDLLDIDKDLIGKTSTIVDELMQSIVENSFMRTTNYKTKGKVEYQEFYPRKSKHFMNKIDAILAEHYGFTDEELDFIINYDIKYRMGGELNDNEG